MEEKKFVPNRRFREFKNKPQWKQSSMKEVVDVYDGTHQTPRYTDSGIMFLSVENIHSLRSNKYISHEDFKRDFKVYPEEGDVLMTRIGDIGTANVVETNEEKAYYVTLALLKKKGMDPYFLKENIHSPSVKRELWHRTLHIAFPKKINMDEIGKILINYPCNLEQQKIGEFFKVLDDRIANQKRKIAKVKALKSAYLTEMFPQQGETVPKRRFAGFKGDWKEMCLGDLSDSFDYGLNAESKKYDGENKYIRITDIDDDTRLFVKNNLTSPNIDYPISDRYILDEGDILFARTGASVGKTYRYNKLDGKVYYAGFLIKATIKDEHDYEFIFQNTLTKKYENFVYITSQRSGQPGINAQEYATYKLMIPTLEEQQKIGEFFKNLDDQIAIEEKKLEKLKKMKEAYLEEMFV